MQLSRLNPALVPVATLLLLALGACGSDDAGDAPKPVPAQTKISKADADAIRAEIYPLWNPPADPPCHDQLKVRIEIAEDGRVTKAEAKPELAYEDPCRGAQDAAIRAIWAASPLNVPRHREWNSLTLVFDRDALM